MALSLKEKFGRFNPGNPEQEVRQFKLTESLDALDDGFFEPLNPRHHTTRAQVAKKLLLDAIEKFPLADREKIFEPTIESAKKWGIEITPEHTRYGYGQELLSHLGYFSYPATYLKAVDFLTEILGEKFLVELEGVFNDWEEKRRWLIKPTRDHKKS